MLDANDFFVNQAVLTGETYPVEKCPGVIPPNAALTERTNCVFMGTNVRSGSARIVIVGTGSRTAFGQIAKRLTLRPPETEFERGIRKLGYLLTEVMFVLVIGIFAVNVFFHKPIIDSLLFSIALAVGLTPQLLPAIININLSKGSQAHRPSRRGDLAARARPHRSTHRRRHHGRAQSPCGAHDGREHQPADGRRRQAGRAQPAGSGGPERSAREPHSRAVVAIARTPRCRVGCATSRVVKGASCSRSRSMASTREPRQSGAGSSCFRRPGSVGIRKGVHPLAFTCTSTGVRWACEVLSIGCENHAVVIGRELCSRPRTSLFLPEMAKLLCQRHLSRGCCLHVFRGWLPPPPTIPRLQPTTTTVDWAALC